MSDDPHASLLKYFHYAGREAIMEAALQQVQFHLEASKAEERKAPFGQDPPLA